jgi:hypothetical protein
MAKISTGYARQLAKNYRNNKLGKQLLADDTQGIWFPKETILEALGLDPKTICPYSGLRFYFGAYEDDAHAPQKHPENRRYCNKITMVIVSTKEISKKQKDDLNEPEAPPTYPTPLSDEFNDGQLCPPPNCDVDGLLNF